MEDYYWAQPEGQRITFKHRNFERLTKSVDIYKKKYNNIPDKIKKLISFLETGPKNAAQIKEFMGVEQTQLEVMLTSATKYDCRLWQANIAPLDTPGHRGLNYYGLAGFGALPEGDWVVT